jgi:hypothetical protein
METKVAKKKKSKMLGDFVDLREEDANVLLFDLPNKVARKKDPVWTALSDDPNPHQLEKITCKHCSQEVLSNRKVRKARYHLFQKCDVYRKILRKKNAPLILQERDDRNIDDSNNVSENSKNNAETIDLDKELNTDDEKKKLFNIKRSFPDWVRVEGKRCFSSKQIINQEEVQLPNTRMRHRPIYCFYCAEFNPTAAWGTVKPRKYESIKLLMHERSKTHQNSMFLFNKKMEGLQNVEKDENINNFQLNETVVVVTDYDVIKNDYFFKSEQHDKDPNIEIE